MSPAIQACFADRGADYVSDAVEQFDGGRQTLRGHVPHEAGSEVHWPGTEELGFGGPSELDDTSVIAPEVLQLLNTPIDQSAFKPLP